METGPGILLLDRALSTCLQTRKSRRQMPLREVVRGYFVSSMPGGGASPSASCRNASSSAAIQISAISSAPMSAPEKEASPSRVQAQRMSDRPPAGVPAVHVLCVESRLAQLDRGLAADVKAVSAVHDHGLGL